MGIVNRYFQGGEDSYFLFGPRGTGKSTWVKRFYPDAKIINLLAADIFREFKSYPERLKDFVLAHPHTQTFVIDEIQKAPELLSIIHDLIELKQNWQFILTGSSARKLKRSGADLLGGRAQLKFLHPFMASEIPNEFDLKRNLELGMLPLVLHAKDSSVTLKAYIALYMQEEVQFESLVRNIEQFGRFLESISFSQASILNCANIARECHVSNKTVENYVQILEDLLLSVRVPVFEKRAKRELASSPKFYFFDCGIFQSVRPMGPLDPIREIGGLALETLVFQHLRAWIDYSDKEGKLYFWRTRSGLEVDFVIYGTIGLYAIEVKSASHPSLHDFRGLKEFKKDYPESVCILLHMGNMRTLQDGIFCIPINDFLLGLKPNTPIE
jgi:predicted AAA+ superfamily ATPase